MDHCGEQYRLHYLTDTPRRPMWAGLGGAAAHACVREFEEAWFAKRAAGDPFRASWDGVATFFSEKFRRHFTEAIAAEALETTYPMSQWYAGSKNEDRDWWLDNGPRMVYDYVMKQEGRTMHVLALPDGSPALEVHATMIIAGHPWQGYVDRIMYDPNARAIVIEDDKFGASWPQDKQQIDTYGHWAERILLPMLPELDVSGGVWARYYMGRSAQYIHHEKVRVRTPFSLIERRYYTLRLLNVAKLYQIKPSNMCKACSVFSGCEIGSVAVK